MSKIFGTISFLPPEVVVVGLKLIYHKNGKFPNFISKIWPTSLDDMKPFLQPKGLSFPVRGSTFEASFLPCFCRFYVLKAREDEIAAYEARMKPIWDAEKAAEKAKANREQLISLAKETGTKVGRNHQLIAS